MTGRLAVIFAAGAMLASASASHAANTCVAAARGEYLDCKTGCIEDFQTAKDACIGRDHDCVEACRAGREDCVAASGLPAALDQCQATMQTAIQACKNQFPPGSTDRDTCIDNAQVDAFICRMAARTAAKPTLTACRNGFKACVKACPSTPTDVDPKTCKKDAIAAFKDCGESCREDFQIAKDACRNMDHACVEACREARQSCDAPIRQQLNQTIASCNATRDAAIAACNGDAACIEAAQVAAFECRDSARETARPGFQACRAGFKACLVGPPGCALP